MTPDLHLVAKRGVARLAAVAALAALAMLETAPIHAASIERLRSFVRDTQTARTTFTQVVTDKAGRVVQRASGEFLISRPGKFRWAVEKPYRQLVVGDGERVWIYDEDLNQVVVRKSREALGTTPAALLAGREDVESAFDWQPQPPSDGLDWLLATPKGGESSFAEIRLGFDDKGLAALVLVDAFGQRSLVRFGEMQRNPALPADAFRFTPPKGADVIGEGR
jgi:outer membrane lipoprotein carrier protein